MALVKAGWFHTTWFPSRWWQEDYWLEYGTAVPTGGDSRHYYYGKEKSREDDRELLVQVKELLQVIK